MKPNLLLLKMPGHASLMYSVCQYCKNAAAMSPVVTIDPPSPYLCTKKRVPPLCLVLLHSFSGSIEKRYFWRNTVPLTAHVGYEILGTVFKNIMFPIYSSICLQAQQEPVSNFVTEVPTESRVLFNPEQG